MKGPQIFRFRSEISHISLPENLNNPFGKDIPEIGRLAAYEFQEYIKSTSVDWAYDFKHKIGKMFGVLVIQDRNMLPGYLCGCSGRMPDESLSKKFVPSVFDDSVGDYFINVGMRALTDMSLEIANASDPKVIEALKKSRRLKSNALQTRLFENYQFLNLKGNKLNLLEIFWRASQTAPPAAAGECAAPKLLQCAFENGLKPIALVEFWWGNPGKYKEKEHQAFYPACRDKCRPILEFMLDDKKLFESAT